MKLSRWIAVILVVALVLFAFSGCLGHAYTEAGEVDGTEISAGLYLMAQFDAYSEAQKLVEDEEKNVLSQKIEGRPAKEWITNRTEELLRRYVCVHRLARERNLQISSEGQQNIDQVMEYWEYLGMMYADNGINQATFLRYMNNEELSNSLFLSLFEDGGELTVSDAELKREYGEKYAHIRFMSIPVNSFTDGINVQDEIEAICNELVEKMKNGYTLEEIAAIDAVKIYEMLDRNYDAESGVDSITDSYIVYDPEKNQTYSAEFLEGLQQQSVGDVGSYHMGSTILLYELIPTFADNDAFLAKRSEVIRALKEDVYEEYLSNIYSAYPVEWVFGARWFLSPSRVKTV